jgi:hypothetical protein
MRQPKVMWAAVMGVLLVIYWWAAVGGSQVKAQPPGAPAKSPDTVSGSQTKNPANWHYADGYDEVTAAGEFYRVRYEDDHIRLVEVGIIPGAHTKPHGDPYPAVIAMDGAVAKVQTQWLDPNSNQNGQGAGHAPPPKGMQYPLGETDAPLAPRTVVNNDTFPLHYFKIEFKRIDGDDYKTHWKTWYPWMMNPLMPILNVNVKDPALGPPVSADYPFALATESYISAPNNHYVRYQDDHVVFLEVVFRYTERENIHGHESPSVFARDTGGAPAQGGPAPAPAAPIVVADKENLPGLGHAGKGGDWKYDPKGNNGTGGGACPPPAGMRWPTCTTSALQWPHAASDTNPYPTHFYRIQFKRMDGDGLKTHWQEWYPWMTSLAVQQKEHASQ